MQTTKLTSAGIYDDMVEFISTHFYCREIEGRPRRDRVLAVDPKSVRPAEKLTIPPNATQVQRELIAMVNPKAKQRKYGQPPAWDKATTASKAIFFVQVSTETQTWEITAARLEEIRSMPNAYLMLLRGNNEAWVLPNELVVRMRPDPVTNGYKIKKSTLQGMGAYQFLSRDGVGGEIEGILKKA